MKIKPRKLKLGELADKLESMTAQEVLNACYGHMVAQGRMSKGVDGHPAYKGVDDDCDPAAPFIKDYKADMERCPWLELFACYGQSNTHMGIIIWFQYAHNDPVNWDASGFIGHNTVSNVADMLDLEMPELELSATRHKQLSALAAREVRFK